MKVYKVTNTSNKSIFARSPYDLFETVEQAYYEGREVPTPRRLGPLMAFRTLSDAERACKENEWVGIIWEADAIESRTRPKEIALYREQIKGFWKDYDPEIGSSRMFPTAPPPRGTVFCDSITVRKTVAYARFIRGIVIERVCARKESGRKDEK